MAIFHDYVRLPDGSRRYIPIDIPIEISIDSPIHIPMIILRTFQFWMLKPYETNDIQT